MPPDDVVSSTQDNHKKDARSVSVVILFAGLMAVLVPLGMLIRQLAFSRAIPILRVASTMDPPVVLLRKGERYHLFLCATPPEASPCPVMQQPTHNAAHTLGRSHVWSTGQDQCAIIKRQLQLLMPGVVIFLDVDGPRPLPPVPLPAPLSCPPTSAPLPCNRPGRPPGYRRPRELRARNRRDALLPVKALL